MDNDIQAYVKHCAECQKAKSSTQKENGLLRPFPPPERKWEVISMDLIFHLPMSTNGNTGIFLVVDNLSKRIRLILIMSELNAKETSEVFYREIYKHHGLPCKIISDRDARFTSTFWTELMKYLRVKLNLFTAFILKLTESQTECFDRWKR